MNEELKEKVIWQNLNSSKEKGKILEGKIIAIEIEKMKDIFITQRGLFLVILLLLCSFHLYIRINQFHIQLRSAYWFLNLH